MNKFIQFCLVILSLSSNLSTAQETLSMGRAGGALEAGGGALDGGGGNGARELFYKMARYFVYRLEDIGEVINEETSNEKVKTKINEMVVKPVPGPLYDKDGNKVDATNHRRL